MFTTPLVNKFWIMPGMGTIVAYSLMVKQEPGSPIVWLGIKEISGLCQSLVLKYLKESQQIKIKILNSKYMSACKKFIMKKFKIF